MLLLGIDHRVPRGSPSKNQQQIIRAAEKLVVSTKRTGLPQCINLHGAEFRCAAQDLTHHHSLKGWSMWLRLDGDSNDPATWHPIKSVHPEGTREDTSQPFVRVLTVSFHDETPEAVLNESDQVEFAVPRPPELPQT
jgi:hypothetical protein